MNIGQWLGKWAGNWFGTVGEADPNAIAGSASFVILASGALTNGGSFASGNMVCVSVFGFSASGQLVAVPPAPTSEQPASYAGRTSRYSDPHAYDHDRVSKRLAKVVIAGREYDPFDDTLMEKLGYLLTQPLPQIDDEMQRQNVKLSRFFEVKTAQETISIPLFRPMLDRLPAFKQSTVDDFSDYKKVTQAAINEERRRIMLLLSEA